MDTDDQIDHITSLIDASLLPELQRDLGSDFIESKHFDSFRESLDHHLIQIFDQIQHNEYLLSSTEGHTRKLRCKFLLLLCEQIAPNTLYGTFNMNLTNNLKMLATKHFDKMLADDSNLLDVIFAFYKERLRKNCWKKHLGAIHGFDTFCQFHYEKNKVDRDMCAFILSVSLLLEEYYEPAYKEISFRLTKIILYKTPKRILYELNLHFGIFDTLFRNIPKVSSVSGITTLWDCLYKCIELMNITDFSKWNKMDDLFEVLISRITFESTTNICIHLILIFPKLCLIQSSNGTTLSECIADFIALNDCEKELTGLRAAIEKEQSKVFYRWVNRLLKLFIAESHRLLVNENNALTLLKAIHICYIVCVTSIPIKVCEVHLIEFIDKFILVLMEILAAQRTDADVLANVKGFLETILHHLSSSSYQAMARSEMSEYALNIRNLLQNNVFQQVGAVES